MIMTGLVLAVGAGVPPRSNVGSIFAAATSFPGTVVETTGVAEAVDAPLWSSRT